MLGEYQQMADSYGMTLDEAFSMVGVADEEELRQQYLEDLEANAKDELVLQAIAEDADIHVTEEDVEDYFKTVVHLEDYSAYEQNYGTLVSAPRCPQQPGAGISGGQCDLCVISCASG